MFRDFTLLSFKLVILILVCSFFLRGQAAVSTPNKSFQNCWTLSARLANRVASDNDNKIFIPLQNSILKAIDTDNNELWSTQPGGDIIAQPIYQDETLYVLSKISISFGGRNKPDRFVYSVSALDTNSGISRWRKEFGSETIPNLFSQKGRLIVYLNQKVENSGESIASFHILDEQTGNLVFEKNYDFEVKEIFSASGKLKEEEKIIMLTSENSVASFSPADGRLVKLNTAIKKIRTVSTYRNGFLLSDESGYIYFVQPSEGENKFKIRFGASVTNMTTYKESILISSLDNFIYLVSSDGKQLVWKRRFAGRITEKPIIDSDTVVVYSQGDSSLYFLNYEDGKVFNRITIADDEEIIGNPLLLNNFVVLTTSKGLKAFSSEVCKNFTAAEK